MNEVEIHITSKDDASKNIDGVSRAAKKATKDIALTQAKINELTAKRNVAVLDIDADVAKAKAHIQELEKKRGTDTKIDVDAEISRAQAKIAALAAKKNRILLEVDIDQPTLATAGKKVEKATEKVAQRAENKFSALKFTALSFGLPAAAAAGAAGTAVALAGVPLLFVGIAAASLKSNQQVTASFTGLSHRVTSEVQGMT
ncbi:MAG: hypothetical protein ACREJC_17605, partial [Tepidisphaeraceae bacterium]